MKSLDGCLLYVKVNVLLISGLCLVVDSSDSVIIIIVIVIIYYCYILLFVLM